MCDSNNFRFGCDKFFQFVQIEFTLFVKRQHLEFGAAVFAQKLPRHDVGVVLHLRYNDLVTRLYICASERGGHQIDGLRGATSEDHFVIVCGMDEILHGIVGNGN